MMKRGINQQSYNAIDVFKFLAAILIIMLHVNPFKGVYEPLALLFRNIVTIIAVPFFFTAAGFLFFKKVDASNDKGTVVKKYVLRLLKMYLIWSVVYFPFVVLQWRKEGVDVLGYVRDFFFEGSYSTIWFLNATIVAALFTYFLAKKLKMHHVFFISLLLYFIGCGLSYYYYILVKIPFVGDCAELYYKVLKTTKNGLLFGAAFFSLGGVLAREKRKGKLYVDVIGLIVSFGFLCIESVAMTKLGYLNKGVDLKVCLVPFSYFLVRILIQIQLPQHKIYKWCRGMSINMFLSQRLFLSIYPLVIPETSTLIVSQPCYFVLILASTFLFSWGMLIVANWIARYKKTKGAKENGNV